MRTEKELKQLALDVVEGRVFTDRHCNSESDVRSVFMVLSLMDKKQIDEMLEKKPAMFYEYLDKANPISVNGMPTFFSLAFITEEEAKIYNPLVAKLLEQREAFLGE
jgi:hypothetical protein